jgi:outer membrane lipoprotein-sorting protein
MRVNVFPRSRTTIAVAVTTMVLATAFISSRAAPSPDLPSIAPGRLLASSLRTLRDPISLSGRVVVDWNVNRHHFRRDRRGGKLAHAAFRVWRSDDGLRVAQVLDFGERLVVANQDRAWYWDSSTLTAHRLASTEVTSNGFDFSPSVAVDPFSLARSILDTFAPYSTIEVVGTATVAGRAVYLLSLRTEQRHTRLRKIVVGIDARTRLPLRLQLYTHRIAAAAFDVRFTSISIGQVDRSLFRFHAPAKATVIDTDVFAGGGTPRGSIAQSTRIFGRGWKTVVAWELSRRLSTDVEAAFPLWNALGSSLTTRSHGRTWILAGFVSLRRLEGDVPKLP